MANLDIRQRILISAEDNTARGTASAQRNLGKLDGAFKRLENTIVGFAGVAILGRLTGSLVRLSDVALDIDSRVRLVTTTNREYEDSLRSLYQISLDNGGQMEANVQLFQRINKPLKALNFTTEDSIALTRLMSEAARVSGATTQESTAAAIQFSQALQSGVLRGEEFNSMTEQNGRATEALAKGLGVTIGQLRKMANEGELTAAKVVPAMLKSAETIRQEAEQMPLTIGRSLENVNTKIVQYLQTNQEFNRTISGGLQLVANNFDQMTAVLFPALKIGLGLLVIAIGRWAASKIEVAKATAVQARAEAELAKTQIARARSQEIQERSHQQRLAITKAQEADLELFRAKTDVTRQNAAAKQHTARIAQMTAMRETLRLEQRRLAYAVRNETDATKLNALLAQQDVAITKVQAATTRLRAERTLLAATENKVTAAVTRQNSAYLANISAQNAQGLAVSRTRQILNKSTKEVQTFGSAATKLIKGVGAALLGWPAIIGLVGYEIAKNFVDMELAGLALEEALVKIMVSVANTWDRVFNPEAYQAAMDEVERQYIEHADAIIAKREAQAQGFDNVEQMQTQKARLAAKEREKIDEAEITKKLNTVAQLQLAENTLFESKTKQLKEQVKLQNANDESAKAALDARLALIAREQDAAEVSSAASIDRASTTSEAIHQIATTRYDREFNMVTQAADAEIQSINSRRDRWDTFYQEHMTFMDTSNKTYLTISNQHQEKMMEIDQAAVKSLSASLKKMIALRDDYQSSVSSRLDKMRSLEQNARDFIAQMNDQIVSNYQKSADAQTRIDDARALLKEANTLDEIKDAARIQELRDKAIADLQEIATEEKSRAAELKGNTADELAAQTNKTQAVELFKEAVEASLTSQAKLSELEQSTSDQLTEQINAKTKALAGYQQSIQEADELVAKQRTLIIDLDKTKTDKKIDEIQARLAELNNRVTTHTVIELRKIVTDNTDPNVVTTTTNTTSDPIRRNSGGPVHGGGTGESDTISAMLTVGEFVVRRDAVRQIEERYGEDAMYQINNGELPPIKRNFGGTVDEQTIDRRVQRIKDSIADKRELTTSKVDQFTARGYGTVGKASNPNYMRGNSWQNGYYDKLAELADGVDGMDNSTVTRVGNLIGSSLNILVKSTRNGDYKKHLAYKEELDSKLLRIHNEVNAGAEFVAAAVTRTGSSRNYEGAETAFETVNDAEKGSNYDAIEAANTNRNEAVNEELRAVSAQRAAVITDVPELDDVKSTASTPISNIDAEGAKAKGVASAISAIKSPLDSVVSSLNSAAQQVSTTTNTATAAQQTVNSRGEVITVILQSNGKTATGTFENNGDTKALLKSLQDEGTTHG